MRNLLMYSMCVSRKPESLGFTDKTKPSSSTESKITVGLLFVLLKLLPSHFFIFILLPLAIFMTSFFLKYKVLLFNLQGCIYSHLFLVFLIELDWRGEKNMRTIEQCSGCESSQKFLRRK